MDAIRDAERSQLMSRISSKDMLTIAIETDYGIVVESGRYAQDRSELQARDQAHKATRVFIRRRVLRVIPVRPNKP